MYHKTYPFRRYNSVVAGIFPKVVQSSAPSNFRAFYYPQKKPILITFLSSLQPQPQPQVAGSLLPSVQICLFWTFTSMDMKGFVVIRGFFHLVYIVFSSFIHILTMKRCWIFIKYFSTSIQVIIDQRFLLFILLILRVTLIYFQMLNLPSQIKSSVDVAEFSWLIVCQGLFVCVRDQ